MHSSPVAGEIQPLKLAGELADDQPLLGGIRAAVINAMRYDRLECVDVKKDGVLFGTITVGIEQDKAEEGGQRWFVCRVKSVLSRGENGRYKVGKRQYSEPGLLGYLREICLPHPESPRQVPIPVSSSLGRGGCHSAQDDAGLIHRTRTSP